MSRGGITFIVTFLVAVFAAALFQNCSPAADQNSVSEKSFIQPEETGTPGPRVPGGTLQSNGDGYTGKPFLNISSSGNCPGKVRGAIEKVDDKFYQTVKDCKNLPSKIDVTADVEYKPHNENAIYTAESLYENPPKGLGYSEIICRGPGLYNGGHVWVDVSLQPTGELDSKSKRPYYKSYIAYGEYTAAGAFIAAQTWIVPKVVDTSVFFFQKIFSVPGSVPIPNMPGSYTLIMAGDSISFYYSNSFVSNLQVDGLECFTHQ